MFKVALSVYKEWITKEEVVKLRSLFNKCLKLRCLCIEWGSPEKNSQSRGEKCLKFYQVFKVELSMYRYLKLRCLCTKGESLKKCLRCLWSVDHQRRSFEVAKTSYQVFKVALSMYRVKIAKEEVKLQSLYQVFEVALSMYRKWITKEVVDGVFITCFKSSLL